MQYKNSLPYATSTGSPAARALTVFSFSLIKQQKTKTKQNKTDLIPQTLVPKR